MDAPVADPVVDAPAPLSAPADPFSLDESRLASLSPEQRAALDPVFNEWKERAKAEIQKTGKTYEEKYKPDLEKARALEDVVKQPWFQTAWQNVQRAATAQNPAAATAIAGTKPQDFASPEEWQNAMAEAYSGDPTRLKDIQARMFATMATPVIQQLKQGQEELRATLEMKDLFERHADAKELDLIGRNANDPEDKNESLLEMCLNWADANGKTLEEGYARAKSWADALRVGAKQEAMGLVQSKKDSITSGPTTHQGGQAVVEVADADELMTKNMEYIAAGQKPPKFVIRQNATVPADKRWAQRQ